MKRKADYKCVAIATWISVYATEHGGNSPTIDEIADHFGIWKSTAHKHVERMIEFDIAERRDGKLLLKDALYVPPRWLIQQMAVKQTSA